MDSTHIPGTGVASLDAARLERLSRARDDSAFALLVDSTIDYAIFMLDPSGYVASWNAGAERIKGYTPAEVIGQHFSIFHPQDAIARHWPQTELETAAREGRFEDEGWRIRKDGTLFWANVVITALRDDDGRLIGFGKVSRDLTERRRSEQQLRESEERFRLIVESTTDYAIFMLDPDGRVVSWNAGAQRIKGYTPGEAIGQHFSVFYTPEANERQWPQFELHEAERLGRFEDEGWRVRKDGTWFWASVVITALRGSDGQLRGFGKVTRDISERKAHQERIENLTRELERRVTQLAATNRELMQKTSENESFVDSDRRKDEFLGMLAHELRNPLAAIMNAGDLLHRTVKDGQPQRLIEVVRRQTRALARMVDDLLDVSRVTLGKIQLTREPMMLGEAVSRAVDSMRDGAANAGLELEVRIDREPLWVSGDMTRLEQVVTNLLTNAVKFTPAAGRITVSVEADGRNAVIRVGDTGIGIPDALLLRVFDLFAQGDTSLDRSRSGLGIGLALVRKIVTLHGGEVTATSAGPGQGSEFLVRIPALPDYARPLDEPPPPPTETRRIRVLVVDDQRDVADSVAMLIETFGHTAHAVYGGVDALAASRAETPDAMFIDIGMPGMTGYELAEHVRRDPTLAQLPLVALTGYGSEEDRARVFGAGFDLHITKPVTDADLHHALVRVAGIPTGNRR